MFSRAMAIIRLATLRSVEGLKSLYHSPIASLASATFLISDLGSIVSASTNERAGVSSSMPRRNASERYCRPASGADMRSTASLIFGSASIYPSSGSVFFSAQAWNDAS